MVCITLSLAPWLILSYVLVQSHFNPLETGKKQAALQPQKIDKSTYMCKPGPWGDIECTKLIIEPPEEVISSFSQAGEKEQWIFKRYSRNQLTTLVEQAQLSSEQKASLLSSAAELKSGGGFLIRPTYEFIWNLSAEQRSTLYSALSAFPENPLQYEPAIIGNESPENWFVQSGLSDRTISLVKHLLYHQKDSLVFSDLNFVLPVLESEKERRTLIRTLLRKETLLVRLCIRPDTDISKILDYWGKEGRSRNIRPIVTALSKIPDGKKLIISTLLPSFARLRLYTYPPNDVDPFKAKQDCLWTALNFFNDTPDEKIVAKIRNQEDITLDFDPVKKDPILGDLVVIYGKDGKFLHAANFIADDVVFTKMGISRHSPWIFMPLKDMLSHYHNNSPLTVRAYRQKKDLPVAAN